MSSAEQQWWRGARGEWYVVVQGALIALVLFGPPTTDGITRWPAQLRPWFRGVGIGLLAIGAAFALAAVRHLRANLSPWPEPRPSSALVVTGPYGMVRHPIYGGLVFMAVGYAFAFGGWLTAVYATGLFALLRLKAAREEHRLKSMFPEYREYRRRTRRMIPFIY
jgi:protein-S-isoprenylcysteine O-methyltransferase Ste14